MTQSDLLSILPQLASGAAHTHALGFVYDGLTDDKAVRIRVPRRPDLVGDAETGVLAGGLVTALLDHVGGLAVWIAMDAFRPIATLDLRVDYMRAAAPGRDLIGQARCYRLTSTIGFVRAWAFEDDPDDPVAAAQAAYMVSEERNAGSPS
ncbi:MAG: PaaI family thioesterase [Brevundimonas sp.]|uniref:PaaI family thioesterase n=1 Tax=Brevundimonas sp. TaxID=1871086 RepID=UPI0025BF9B2D|nr:PaaI family thioesterase [Brevundimonas sp.]MBX3477862.1 PaaI family thioesterase [Brevundimonas sp.]